MQYQRYQERGWVKSQGEPFEGKTLRIFDQGHTMHARWAKYAQDIGILRGYWNCTNPLCNAFDDSGTLNADKAQQIVKYGYKSVPRVFGKDNVIGCFKPIKCKCGCSSFEYQEIDVIDKEMNFAGHCDMVFDFSNLDPTKYDGIKKTFNFDDLPKLPIVIDMKTINDYGYSKILKSGPSNTYKIQLTIYCNVLPVEYAVLLYQNKNSAETAIYQIEKNSDTIFAKIKNQAITMNQMADKKLLPPPRPDSKDSYECDKCAFKNTCHASKVWEDPKLDQKRKQFYGNLI